MAFQRSIIGLFLIFLVVSAEIPMRQFEQFKFVQDQFQIRHSIWQSIPKLESKMTQNSEGFLKLIIEYAKDIALGNLQALIHTDDVKHLPSQIRNNVLMAFIHNGEQKQRQQGEKFVKFDIDNKQILILEDLMNNSIQHMQEVSNHKFKHSFTIKTLQTELEEKILFGYYESKTGEFRINRKFLELIDGDLLSNSMLSQLYADIDNISSELLKDQKEENLQNKMVMITERILNNFKYNVWECIACIIVLAIALPLGANFLIAAIIQQYCKWENIDPITCFNIVLDAVSLVNILLPVVALVIFKVCQLNTQCKN